MEVRALASVAEISALLPIQNADRIVLAQFVDKAWEVIVSRDDHAVGDRGVLFEVDSFLPERAEYEELRKSSYRKLQDGLTGFYVRTIKLRGVYSQGYFVKAEKMSKIVDLTDLPLHDDLTAALGVIQFPDPSHGDDSERQSNFPPFLRKTDEKRIENSVSKYHMWRAQELEFMITEKLDGCSFTAFLDINSVFGYCTRNYQLKVTDTPSPEVSLYSDIVKKYDLETRLRTYGPGIAVQGEIIGPKLQKNRYKRASNELYIFTAWDIAEQKRISSVEVAEKMGLPHVPVVTAVKHLPETVAELRQLADGPSLLNPSADREGFVLRALSDPSISFKVISRKFLAKEK